MTYDLPSLIERLEKAEGPDRELDAEIRQAVAPRSSPYPPLPYTASLDAAVGLVPEGDWEFEICRYIGGDKSDLPGPRYDVDLWKYGAVRVHFGRSNATPALALCIAALKALKDRSEN